MTGEPRDEHIDSWTTQLRKGLVELAILALLEREPLWGYAIARALSAGSTPVAHGDSVYPVLRRLQAEELISAEDTTGETKRQRTMYRLTPEGTAFIIAARSQWRGVSAELDRLLSAPAAATPAEVHPAAPSPATSHGAAAPGARTPLVEVRNAQVVRDGRTILDIGSLTFSSGEHTAILGPNGAGKSTLIALMTRDILPLASPEPAVLLRGRDRWDLFEARQVFGVVSERLQNDHRKRLQVLDVVLSGFFGSVGLYRRAEVTAAMVSRAMELLEFLEIENLAERMMDTLSTGEARRALIGRALAHDPGLLVLDEPTGGLDPSGTYLFLQLLRRLAEHTTLVIVTHHVSDIVPEVERVVMLRSGAVFRDGRKEDLLVSDSLSELYDAPTHLEPRDGWYLTW